HEMIMVREHRPRFQLPTVLLGQSQQLPFQQVQSCGHSEVMLYVQRGRRHQLGARLLEAVERCVGPRFGRETLAAGGWSCWAGAALPLCNHVQEGLQLFRGQLEDFLNQAVAKRVAWVHGNPPWSAAARRRLGRFPNGIASREYTGAAWAR